MKFFGRTLAVIACLVLVFSFSAASAETIKWDMANEYQPNSVHGETTPSSPRC